MNRFRLQLISLSFMLLGFSAVLLAREAPSDSSGFVEVEQAKLYFRAVGSGTPLVMVHGGPGLSHGYMAPQYIELFSDDYRLIFYDQRGSGRSTGIEDTTLLTMDRFVEDLDQIRQAFGLDQMNLLGHSFGGLIALLYAAENSSKVKNLLLIDSAPTSWELNIPPFLQTIEERRDRAVQMQMDSIMASPVTPESMERWWHLYFRPFFHDPALSDSLPLDFDRQWIENYSVTSPIMWRRLGKFDFHDRLEKITARTLVLYCDQSVLSREGAEAIHKHIPHSRFIVLEGIGHFPSIEAPQALKAAVKAFVW